MKSLTASTLCDTPGPMSFCCPRVVTIMPRFASALMSRLTVLTPQFKSFAAMSPCVSETGRTLPDEAASPYLLLISSSSFPVPPY